MSSEIRTLYYRRRKDLPFNGRVFSVVGVSSLHVWRQFGLPTVFFFLFGSMNGGEHEKPRSGVTFMDCSVKEALYQAKRRQRPVFLFVYGEFCNNSARMENFVFKDKDVRTLMNNKFICKRYDSSDPFNNFEASNWGIHNVPGYVFMTNRGKIVKIDAGYKSTANFLTMANEVLETINSPVQEKEE